MNNIELFRSYTLAAENQDFEGKCKIPILVDNLVVVFFYPCIFIFMIEILGNEYFNKIWNWNNKYDGNIENIKILLQSFWKID